MECLPINNCNAIALAFLFFFFSVFEQETRQRKSSMLPEMSNVQIETILTNTVCTWTLELSIAIE